MERNGIGVTFREKRCTVCSKPFSPSSGRQVICSPECKKKYRVMMYSESNKRNKAARIAAKKLLTQSRIMWQNVTFHPVLDALVMQSQTTWRDLFAVRDWVCSQSNQS